MDDHLPDHQSFYTKYKSHRSVHEKREVANSSEIEPSDRLYLKPLVRTVICNDMPPWNRFHLLNVLHINYIHIVWTILFYILKLKKSLIEPYRIDIQNWQTKMIRYRPLKNHVTRSGLEIVNALWTIKHNPAPFGQ